MPSLTTPKQIKEIYQLKSKIYFTHIAESLSLLKPQKS